MPPSHVDVPAQQVEPREGDVLGPDHERQQEVAERAGIDGIRKRKIMITPCIVNSRL